MSLPELPPQAFAKQDTTPDLDFYAPPRLVHHIDEGAVAALTSYYRELIAPGADVPLEGEYAPGHPRAVVAHQTSGEPLRTLPPVVDGDLRLTQGGNPGELTRGDFSLRFEETGGYGSGRTLFGTFSGLAADAGFDPIPDAGG